MVRHIVTRLVSELSPAAVVLSAPRRHRVAACPALARWPIGRSNLQRIR
jgi:hypothetical protein